MAIDAGFLGSLPYFSGLNQADIEALKQAFFEKSVDRSEMLFLEGDPAETLYFLVSGVVKLYKTSAQGKEQIISLARPGEVLNDIPFFDSGPNPFAAEAMGPVTVYGVKKDRLDPFLHQHQSVASGVIRGLTEHTRRLISLVEDLSFRHVIGRVVKILLENAANGDGRGRRLTQQEMAAMAGTAREVVARSLKILEDRGLIRFDRHRIVINDRRAMEEAIEGGLET